MTVDPQAPDLYVERWYATVAAPGGPLEDSAIGEPTLSPWCRSYDVELARGRQQFSDALGATGLISQYLGVRRDRLVFERGPAGSGAQWLRMSIIHGDPAQFGRWFQPPTVRGGVIERLGQHMDGRTEVAVRMWTKRGMVPTMIVGDHLTGRTTFGARLVCGAMSTGTMNAIYIDPLGAGSPALHRRAAVSLTGDDAGALGGQLLSRILDGRAEFAARTDQDLLWPTGDIGGLTVLHEDFGMVSDSVTVCNQWSRIASTVRSLAVWPVIINAGLELDLWGDDQVRTACSGQIIALRVAAESDGQVPGIEVEPSDLPLDDAGRLVAGVGLQAGLGRANMPFKLDWLPADEESLPFAPEHQPPFRVGTALDAFCRPRPLHPVDVASITAVLGEPVGGRWVVGGERYEAADRLPALVTQR